MSVATQALSGFSLFDKISPKGRAFLAVTMFDIAGQARDIRLSMLEVQQCLGRFEASADMTVMRSNLEAASQLLNSWALVSNQQPSDLAKCSLATMLHALDGSPNQFEEARSNFLRDIYSHLRGISNIVATERETALLIADFPLLSVLKLHAR